MVIKTKSNMIIQSPKAHWWYWCQARLDNTWKFRLFPGVSVSGKCTQREYLIVNRGNKINEFIDSLELCYCARCRSVVTAWSFGNVSEAIGFGFREDLFDRFFKIWAAGYLSE